MAEGNGMSKCEHGIPHNEWCPLCKDGPSPDTDPKKK